MLTQEYLKIHSLTELENELGIKYTLAQFEPLVILNYSQIDSPKFNPIVAECRGLVLEVDSWNLVARSFPRFFNWGECPKQAAFDWDHSSATAKEDGSLVLVYWYGGWKINTRGSFGLGEVNKSGKTWNSLFSEAVGPIFDRLDKNLTYVFELTSPYNKVVRYYKEPTAFLLSVFDGEIEWPQVSVSSFAEDCGLIVPTRYSLRNPLQMQDLIKIFEEQDKTLEGVVLRDSNNMRMKCKTSTYISLHRLCNNGNIFLERNLVPLVLDGETSEVLQYFPELKENLDNTTQKVKKLWDELVDLWVCNNELDNQKDFALAVKDHPLSSILFKARSMGVNPRKVFESSKDLIVKVLER